MYAIKSGWGGQTFALAKSNEPGGGRKSRIRRSKEERKEMVESFIKKYQSLNNGNFPSLNLTHKEVGGSFYTVREIVRDLIQENRVLGPGKSLPDEQNSDQSFREYPLGTMSLEPESSLKSTNGSHFVLGQHQSSGGDADCLSDGLSLKLGPQGLDNGQNIDGSNAIVDHGSYGKQEFIEVQVIEAPETEKNMVEVASPAMAAQLEDVEVEASPPQSTHDQSENLIENYGQETVLALEESEDEKLHLELGDNGSFGIGSSEKFSLVNNIEAEISAGPSLERNSSQVDGKATKSSFIDLDAQKSVEEAAVFEEKASKMANVIVETFPSQSVVDSIDYLDANYGEVSKLHVEEKGNKEVILGVDKDRSFPEGLRNSQSSFSLNAKEFGEPAQSLLEQDALLVVEKVEEELTDPLLGSSSTTVMEGMMHGSSQLDMNADESNSSIAITETEVVEIPSGVKTITVKGTNVNASSSEATKEDILLKNEAHIGSAKEGHKLTLERINLESWEGVSTKRETNPLLAMIRSFIAAFMKLWSE